MPKLKETDISFLKSLRSKLIWDLEKAQALVGYAKTGMSVKDIADNLTRDFDFTIKSGGVNTFITELRKAAKEGYTLERYIKEDRPFGAWKKLVQ